MKSNLEIVSRLLELARNQQDYSIYPKPYNESHIYLSNLLNEAKRCLEKDFEETFREAVARYKGSLANGGSHGWFYQPEKLVYLQMQIDQVNYAVYGNEYVNPIEFKKHIGPDAHKDLILQIDPTALMTDEEKMAHSEECCRIAASVLQEILDENSKKS